MTLIGSIAVVFLMVYLAIILEEWLHWDRALLALGGSVLLWGLYALGDRSPRQIFGALEATAFKTSQIVLFLLVVMMLVEWINENGGFEVLKKWLLHDSALQEVWRVTWMTFFLSAVIDNMTSTLIMLAIVKGRYLERDRQWTLVSLVVLAANAGGAWSPIGDVTTTMLWIAGKVSPWGLIKGGFVAAVLNCLIPLLLCSFSYMGSRASHMRSPLLETQGPNSHLEKTQNTILFIGLSLMLLIPLVAHFFHFAPAMVAVMCLAFIAACVDPLLIRAKGKKNHNKALPHANILSAFIKIDWSSMVFILGILLCMDVLYEAGLLGLLSGWMQSCLGDEFNQVFSLGLLSAVLDNIPLVSASLNVFDVSVYPSDHGLWLLLAYCAGTGGSLLVLGSAAGVVAMGQEGLKFAWYLKHFSFKALMGYVAGALVFWLAR
jgi:hypothetical protein